jgi:formiminotetrahydrofolate cyclodeaminase
MADFKLPKDSVTQEKLRAGEIEKATLGAAKVPLKVAGKAARVIELAAQIAAIGNLNAISDSASGAAMARAALTSAGYNVRINVNSLVDKAAGADLLSELKQIETNSAQFEAEIHQALEKRGGITV